MKEPELFTPNDVWRLIGRLSVAAPAEEWLGRKPGEFPMRCRFCGERVTLRMSGLWSVQLCHIVPLCPEFVWYVESELPPRDSGDRESEDA